MIKFEGFALGSTIQSKTKGIWVWCRRHPKFPGTVMMLLDTEGLGDVAKGDIGHDNRIFTLAVLLSNVLVFNIMHAFNQDAVEKLTFIAEMSKSISFKNKVCDDDASGDHLQLILPRFVLCLRDFTLNLEIDGQCITADEYLETCLRSKQENDTSSEKYNRPRECIRKYFVRRKCFTFDSPGNRAVIQQLEKLDLKELSEDFRKDTDKFLQYIYSCEPKQLLHSKPVTGQMFSVIAESYVKSITEGGVPDVDDAFLAVSNLENGRLAKEAVEEFKKILVDFFKLLPIPQAEKLDKLREQFVNESLKTFRSQLLFKSDEFERRTIVEMNSLWNEVKEKNLELAKKFCEKELHCLYAEILEDKIRNKKYHNAGGFEKYKKDRRKVEEKFKQKVKEFDDYVVKGVICSLAQTLEGTEQEIMDSDKKLNEEEKNNLKKSMQKEIDDANLEHKKLIEQHKREEEMRAKEYTRQQEEQRKMFEEREKEKLKMLKKDFEYQREQQNKQMEHLQNQLMEHRRIQQERDRDLLNIRIPNPFNWFS